MTMHACTNDAIDRCMSSPKAVFMESLTIMTLSRRSRKLEVKGGFYSKDDMKTELGYSQNPACILCYPLNYNQLYKNLNILASLRTQVPCRNPPSTGQPRSRTDKIVAWAEKKGLVRRLGIVSSSHSVAGGVA